MVAVLALIAIGCAAGGYVVTNRLRSDDRGSTPAASTLALPSPRAAAAAAPPAAATPAEAAVPTVAGVEAALRGPLADARLGTRVVAQVRDATNGAVLLDRAAATPVAPASTAKLATAAAVLIMHAPTDRITTRVVAGATPGQVVLVGAGDPTLTAAPAGDPGAYPEAARVTDLAAAVKAAGVTATQVVVDGSRFTGPEVGPGWAPEDAPSAYASPITAAMVDGGRTGPEDETRSADPAAAAGQALAAALGLPASAVVVGSAPAGARVLGQVVSAPIGTLVEQMLSGSDNVIAECLARQVAIAGHQPASFAGAALATVAALRGAGVNIGPGLLDGSGLSPNDRLSPTTVAALLQISAAGARTALRDVIDGLSVGGWDGTLATRFAGSAGLGIVRGKSGTLTGVSALAGVVRDRDGRLLVFSLVADQVPAGGTYAAQRALDAIATGLVGCGCR
jgi:D-alanyl-D-alanine carboxypeptidase/D-alanyl-D-alanine-endopeptidase (penicillin-binding protein 4)